MSTAVSAVPGAVPTFVQTTDTVLSEIQSRRYSAYEETQGYVDCFYPKWEATAKQLEKFRIDIFDRVTKLQDERVIPSSREDLDVERGDYLRKYWGFKEKCEVIHYFCSSIERMKEIVTSLPCSSADELRLSIYHPKHIEQVKRTDELSKWMLGELGKNLIKVKTLKDRMLEECTKLYSPVQQFSEIVQNNGRPISYFTVALCASGIRSVPKIESQQEVKTNESSGTCTELAVSEVSITDNILSTLDTQREGIFQKTQKFVKIVHPKWEETARQLETFRLKIRERGSELQHEKVVPPRREVLELEREIYLREYWELKDECETVTYFCSFLQEMMKMMTPKATLAADEQRLRADHPKLLQQIQKIDELDKIRLSELEKILNVVSALKDKMSEEFTLRLDKPMQRYCQVVDNEGKPISKWTRLYNTATARIIPKPRSQAELQQNELLSSLKFATLSLEPKDPQ